MVKKNSLGVLSSSLLLVLSISCFNILFSSTVSADDAVTSSVSITIPVSCNLVATEGTAHFATINAGMYQDDIGTTTFKVTCNDTSGYSVYAIGYSNNEYGNTKLLATVGGTPTPTYDIVTGIGTNSTETGGVSNWAMKLAPVTGTYTPTIESAPNTQGGSDVSFTSYHVVPSTYTKVVTYPSQTDTIAGSSFTSTYAAYIASDQPAGTYDGKVKYTLVHPANADTPTMPHDATVGCISYWPNASGVTDNMGDDCNSNNYYSNSQTDVMLWPTNFKRDGYGFAGWSDQHDYKFGATTNTGHIYGPMESIILPSDMATKGLSLYAVWVKSAGNLQGWNGCSSLASGAVTALTDARDNNTYTVAKLADGKCWMIENLRLADKTSNNTAIVLSSDNTHAPSLPLTNNYSQSTTSDSLSASQDPTQTAWCGTNSAACNDQSMLFTGNTSNNESNMTGIGQNIYSYGNYYNWYSATAGHGTYSISTGNSSVSGDICPAGWHLPKGGDDNNASNSDFRTLAVAVIGSQPNDTWFTNFSRYNDVDGGTQGTDASKAIRVFPNNFLYSGYVNGSSVGLRGSVGRYWSSTVYNSINAHNLYLYSSNVYPGTSTANKYNGFAARCVAGV